MFESHETWGFCSASDSAYSYTFFHGVVCLPSVCLSHSCTLLKPFDGFRCHLAGTLVGSIDTSCQSGPDPQGTGDLGSRTHSQNMQLQIAAKPSVLCCRLANTKITNEERFRLLPNYFSEHIVTCFSLA